MSKQVDERVVSMQFDNKRFEENVKTTMGSLDKLKEKLSFKGVSKGFDDINKSAKNTDLSPLAKSVETVQTKFSALQVMGVTALANITNTALNSAKRIAKAFTIDPIKTGFQEYETQINSVQTILANTESKGSTLQDVNNALAELNTYADKTIYNFTEMTRNIGTFTAAGVDLKTSVSAIKGIANLAAVSGSTSQQASTAMYQLSQALSSGTVKLMDWNSVVNAGMGGQVFQDALKETARVHKVNIDAMIKKEGSFRETLQNGWLTAEILTETLSKFTGDLSEQQLKSMGYTDEQIKGIIKMGKTANDAATKVKTFTQLFDTLKEAAQSGWTKSWELLIGDFGEAKDLLTDISNLVSGVIGDSSDKRNAMLLGGLSTGWKQLLNEGIHDAAGFEEMVSNVAKEHGVDIASMVNDETSFQDVLKKTLKEGTLTSDVLGESISKFTEKTASMSAAELEAAGYTKDHIEKLKELDKKVKDGSVSMEEFSKLIIRPSGRELLIESLWNSINGLKSVLTPIKQAFEEVFKPLTGDDLYKIIEGIRDFTSKLTLSSEQSEKLKSTFKGLFSIISVGVNVFKSIVSGCTKLLGALLPIGEGLLDIGSSFGDFTTGLSETANKVLVLDGIFEGLAKLLRSLSTGVGETLSALAGGIEKCGGFIGILQKVTDVIGQLFDRVTVAMPGNSIFDTLFDLVNGGIFATIGIHIARFMKNIGDISEGLPNLLEGVGDALEAFTGSIKAGALQKIATAIGILAASLFVLSLIEPERLTTSLLAISILFKGLMASMTSFGKVLDGNAFKGITKVVGSMIGISVALLILSGALKILSTITWKEMLVGLGGLIVGLGALVGTIYLLPEKDIKKVAKSIQTLSTSLVILAVALKILGSMTWQEMLVGLGGMAVGLYSLVGAINLLPKDTKTKAGSILTLASAMVVMSVALKILASMTWQEMLVGLGGMVVGLYALIGAVNLLPKDTKTKAGSVFVLASAMVVLGAALKIFASMPWQELAIAIGAMAISLGVLVGALWLLPKDVAGKAASILILSTAMLVLGAALKVLGSMSIEQLAKGIGAIAATLVVLGVAAYLLSPVSGVLLAIGGAIALLGVGCLAAGAGLILIATGITALVAAIVGSAGIIVAGANEIVGVFTTIILSLVTAIVTCIPAITNGVLQLLVSVMTGLVQYTPQIVGLLFDFLVVLLNDLAARAPEFIGSIANLIVSVINGLAEHVPAFVSAGINLFGAIIQGIADAIGPVLEILSSAFSKIIDSISGALSGVADIISSCGEAIRNALEGISSIFDSVFGGISDIITSVGDSIRNVLDGIAGIIESIGEAALDAGTGFDNLANGVKTITKLKLADMVASLAAVAAGIGDIAKHADELKDVGDGMNSLVESIKAATSAFSLMAEEAAILPKAIKSKIDECVENLNASKALFYDAGMYMVDGFAQGVSANAWKANQAAIDMAKGVLASFQNELEIHSPSVVMNKQGHYVVQGVAEGIKKDMSAEEAAEKKAQNIVNAFKKVFDKINIDSEIAKNEFELWKSTDGKKLSSIEQHYKYEKFLDGQLDRDKKTRDAAYDKWQQMLANGFKADSQEAKEAFNEFVEASRAVVASETAVKDAKVEEWDIWADKAQKAIDRANSEYETWLATEGKYVDKETRYKKLQELLEYEKVNLQDIENRAKWKLDWLKANGATEDEIAEAQESYNTAVQNRVAKEDEIEEFDHTRKYSDKYDEFDKAEAQADRNKQIWLAKNPYASTAEELTFDKTQAQEAYNRATEEWHLAVDEYNEILEKFNNGLATAEEKEAARVRMEEKWIDQMNAGNKVSAITKSILENARDIAKDKAELASEIAEHEYNVWEKTEGRKATDTEKDIKRLELYNRQLVSQTRSYNLALEAMREARSTYGSDSQEYRDAYREVLREESSILDLQDKILTTKEDLEKRQKKQYNKQQLAMSEYKDYIKKYKQYYLEHGLTMEDLERDAKAAANYDPAKTVESVVSKTSSALGKALNGSGAYSLGSSYVDSVSTGMTENMYSVTEATQTMLTECSETLSESQPKWEELGYTCAIAFGNGITKASFWVSVFGLKCANECMNTMKQASRWEATGKQCVIGFANGLRDNVSIATAAASYVARRAVAAAEATFDVNSPSKVFWNTARFCVEGLAGGFVDNSNISEAAAKSMAEDAVDSFTMAIQQITDSVDSELNAQPTIRPVLDLSNVERGAARLTNMFSRDQAVGISAMRNASNKPENQNGSTSSGSEGKTINYVQNNYSPKALSPTDIYRRTKNQLSAMKGVL